MNMEMESPLKGIVEKYPVRARLIRETHIKEDEDFPRIEGLTFEHTNRVFEGSSEQCAFKTK